jgi:hypothetical protein
VLVVFQEFCSADAGVKNGFPERWESVDESVARTMREPKIGSVMMELAGPIAGGVAE